ncbi:MAG: hypothetical protein SNJ82_00375 [Gemmataceae bacterium]
MGYLNYPPKPQDCLNSNDAGVFYTIVERLGEGGKGITYKATQNGGNRDGQVCAVKIPKIAFTDYSLSEINQYIQQSQRDLQNEMIAFLELKAEDGIAPILDVAGQPWLFQKDGRDKPIMLFHTVYPYIEGFDLGPSPSASSGASWCERLCKNGDTFTGLSDVRLWFSLARQLFEILDRVHYQRIVHGDIWPPNIRMTSEGKPILIDFGQAWSLEQSFGRRSDVSTSHPYLAPERYKCSERKTRWFASADIYSMGGVLFYLATGQAPPQPWQDREGGTIKSNRVLKQEVAAAIKERNRPLFEANLGVVDIIMSCLCPNLDYRAKYAGIVLQTINAFDDDCQPSTDPIREIEIEFNRLRDKLKELGSQSLANNPVVQNVVLRRLRALREDLAPLEKRVFNVEGDREAHVNGLLDCVSTLQSGDELFAVTSTLFWKKGNFGPYGRLSAMLIRAALRGAKIQWVVLARRDNPEDREVLEYLHRAVSDYQECNQATMGATSNSGLEMKCRYTDQEEIDRVRRERDTGILLKLVRQEAYWTLIAPDYSNEEKVSIVRIWADPIRRERLIEAHNQKFTEAQLIQNLFASEAHSD